MGRADAVTPDANWRYEAAAGAPGAPVLLLLHGTGGDERDMLGVGHRLAPSAGRISPRGRISEGGMARFFSRSAHDPFEFPDFEERIAELAEFVAETRAADAFAGRPLVAVGYSNGANAATGLLMRAPGLLAGAVLLRGLLPAAPAAGLDLGGAPVLVALGADDHLIPARGSEELIAALSLAGADVSIHRAPAGHGLTTGDFTVAADWLAERFPEPRLPQ